MLIQMNDNEYSILIALNCILNHSEFINCEIIFVQEDKKFLNISSKEIDLDIHKDQPRGTIDV